MESGLPERISAPAVCALGSVERLVGKGLRPEHSEGWAGPPGLRERAGGAPWVSSVWGGRRSGPHCTGRFMPGRLSRGSCRALLRGEWLSSSERPLHGWRGWRGASAARGSSSLSLCDVPEPQGMLPTQSYHLWFAWG